MTRSALISRLTLGTAQLGMRYGVVGSLSAPTTGDTHQMLEAAWASGITCIDTARAYGEAEARIGEWRMRRQANPFLISKLPPVDDPERADVVESAFAQSATALQVDYIDAYLCHRAADLDHRSVRMGLEQLVERKRIGAFGVSVYTPAELIAALALAPISFVQLPLSLANLRFANEGLIEIASARGILVFARSIYLQGILLSPPDRLPPWLSQLAHPLRRFHELAARAGTSPTALAMASVASVAGVHSIVVGAERPDQLAHSVAASRAPPPEPAVIEEARLLFADVPPELTDPSRWPAH